MTFPQQQWFFYLKDSLILATESDTNLGLELALNSSWEHLDIYMYEKLSISQEFDSKLTFKKELRLSYVALIKPWCPDQGNSLPGLGVH